MTFGQPWHLYFLLLVPIALLLYVLHFQWKVRAQALFAQHPLSNLLSSVNPPRQYLKGALLLGTLLLLIFASAQPRLEADKKPSRGQGADIMIALDVSLSMAAQDVSPSRLERAKGEVLELIDRLENDRVGLVLFSQRGILRFPLTYDLEVAKALLKGVEVERTPRSGTYLEEGIRTALRGLKQSESQSKFIILVSDGEDQGSPFTQAAGEASEEGITIYTLGIGQGRGGPIPLQEARGQPQRFKLDSGGQVVITRLEEGNLKEISRLAEGKYFSPGAGAMSQLYREISSKKGGEGQGADQVTELFQVFALLALLTLVAEPVISERRGAGR